MIHGCILIISETNYTKLAQIVLRKNKSLGKEANLCVYMCVVAIIIRYWKSGYRADPGRNLAHRQATSLLLHQHFPVPRSRLVYLIVLIIP